MADVEIPRRPPSPRDLQERRPIRDDYRSPSWRAAEREVSDGPGISDLDTPNQRSAEMNTGTTVNLRRLQEQLTRKPLEEIAILVHGLTFGEMMEFAEGVWKAQPEGSAITPENLPTLLHRWSQSVSAARSPAVAEKGPSE
jgi:hypothetical protein